MRLTDEMKQMVKHLRLCYVATVTPDGKPNLSPKGTLKVWDDGDFSCLQTFPRQRR